MKTVISIEERNSIVVKHLPMIDKVMKAHLDIVRAARMERDDIYQQLAERLITAVDAYDSRDGGMEGYLETRLERELFRCARPRRSYGQPKATITFAGNRAASYVDARGGSADSEKQAA